LLALLAVEKQFLLPRAVRRTAVEVELLIAGRSKHDGLVVGGPGREIITAWIERKACGVAALYIHNHDVSLREGTSSHRDTAAIPGNRRICVLTGIADDARSLSLRIEPGEYGLRADARSIGERSCVRDGKESVIPLCKR